MSFVPAPAVPARVVDITDWAVLGLTCAIAAASLLGAAYCVPWTPRSRAQASTRAFNYLWTTRTLLQLIAALYALSLDLRLEVLFSYRSPIIKGGLNVDVMCRLYIGLCFGFLEPVFLLLVLFSCMYTVHKHGNDPGSNPNLFIFALTVGLTLPMCAAQVFAALFSRIMTQLQYNEAMTSQFFAASAQVGEVMCPAQQEHNPNCAVCLFPEFSTLISAAFALLYLLVLWYVAGRVAETAVNRMLARRIRTLQVCVTGFFCTSIALRGVTVLFAPFTLGFVVLSVANSAMVSALIVSVSAILVWVPVYDGRAADQRIRLLQSSSLIHQPTELVPLVGYKSREARGSGGGGHGRHQHSSRLLLLQADPEAAGSDAHSESDCGR